ncbi:MAG: DUF6266 family protein [Bacteroides sp.]|nr:DUF6266 family protein [Ruminococcus flavefaciens]MCM1554301.1 DUF6266 family protein [Bacteroides sp.]
MGVIKQGILGGFSGKVGTVIGGSWKGISYMRALAQSYNDARTEKQVNQRSKFRIALKFLQSISPFIKIGYKSQANKRTAMNAAMAHVVKETFNADGTAIDFAKVVVSRGSLPGVMGCTADVDAGQVKVSWSDNSDTTGAATTDKIMFLLYNENRGEAVYQIGSTTRTDTSLTYTLPDGWATEKLHGYLAFQSEDSRTVSDSIYLGEIVEAA